MLPPVLTNEPALAWGIAAALLGIAELIAPGFSLIWLGGAAAFTAAATALLGLSWVGGAALFAVSAIGSVYVSRRLLQERQVFSDDPLINERPARLIGQKVRVVEPLVSGVGRVQLGDATWLARGPDLPAGASATVVGVRGGALVVSSALHLSGGERAST